MRCLRSRRCERRKLPPGYVPFGRSLHTRRKLAVCYTRTCNGPVEGPDKEKCERSVLCSLFFQRTTLLTDLSSSLASPNQPVEHLERQEDLWSAPGDTDLPSGSWSPSSRVISSFTSADDEMSPTRSTTLPASERTSEDFNTSPPKFAERKGQVEPNNPSRLQLANKGLVEESDPDFPLPGDERRLETTNLIYTRDIEMGRLELSKQPRTMADRRFRSTLPETSDDERIEISNPGPLNYGEEMLDEEFNSILPATQICPPRLAENWRIDALDCNSPQSDERLNNSIESNSPHFGEELQDEVAPPRISRINPLNDSPSPLSGKKRKRHSENETNGPLSPYPALNLISMHNSHLPVPPGNGILCRLCQKPIIDIRRHMKQVHIVDFSVIKDPILLAVLKSCASIQIVTSASSALGEHLGALPNVISNGNFEEIYPEHQKSADRSKVYYGIDVKHFQRILPELVDISHDMDERALEREQNSYRTLVEAGEMAHDFHNSSKDPMSLARQYARFIIDTHNGSITLLHFISKPRIAGFFKFMQWWGQSAGSIYNKLTYFKRLIRALWSKESEISSLKFAGILPNSGDWEAVIQFLKEKSSNFKKQLEGAKIGTVDDLRDEGKWLSQEEGALVVSKCWSTLADLLPSFESNTVSRNACSIHKATLFQSTIMVLLPFFCLGGQRSSVTTQFSEETLTLSPDDSDQCGFLHPIREKTKRDSMMTRIPICNEFGTVLSFFKKKVRPVLLGKNPVSATFLAENGSPITSQAASRRVQKLICSIVPSSDKVGYASIRRIIPSWINREKPIHLIEHQDFWNNYVKLANTSIKILTKHYIRTDNSRALESTIEDTIQVLWGAEPGVRHDRELVTARMAVFNDGLRTSITPISAPRVPQPVRVETTRFLMPMNSIASEIRTAAEEPPGTVQKLSYHSDEPIEKPVREGRQGTARMIAKITEIPVRLTRQAKVTALSRITPDPTLIPEKLKCGKCLKGFINLANLERHILTCK